MLPTSQEKKLASHLWRDADAVCFSGLAFSGLSPESYDLAPANLYDREQSHHGLTQEEPQVHGFLLTPTVGLLSMLPGWCQGKRSIGGVQWTGRKGRRGCELKMLLLFTPMSPGGGELH